MTEVYSMRHGELEMYRWKYHRDIYIPSVIKHKSHCTNRAWWKDYAAFTSIMPRQSGKTYMLSTLAKTLESRGEGCLFIVPDSTMGMNVSMNYWVNTTTFDEFRRDSSMAFSDINLFVDEFEQFDQKNIDYLFDFEWKSVTMTGSMRCARG